MNAVDLACLALLLASALLGLLRGFTREALGLASWAGAAFGGFLLLPDTAPVARGLIGSAPIAEAVAWGVGFLVLLVVLSMVTDAIARLVRRLRLGGIDRALGTAFGLARGAAILVAAYMVGSLLLPPARWPAPVRDARALPLAFRGARIAITLLPEGARPQILPPDAAEPGTAGPDPSPAGPPPDRSEPRHAA